MSATRWEATRLHVQSEKEEPLWELFHENSKTGHYSEFLPNEVVHARMMRLRESLPYEGYPIIELPTTYTPLTMELGEALRTRQTARVMGPTPLTLENVATLLHHAYGITRDLRKSGFPRPFRMIPSGGALYPLEIYFHTSQVTDLDAGLYHYNPTKNHLRFLRPGDETQRLAGALVQRNLATDSSLIFFITAIFERAIFKYNNRGYRFIFLEAGHLVQNLNLVATGMGLGCTNIGGYFDRDVDEFLGLDGLNHSTIYLNAIGQDREGTQEASTPV